jgi:hypothetical protein
MTLTCSAQRLVTGEPLAGSAPYARLWVLVEQPGPWGRDAVRESHLDAHVAGALSEAVADRPARAGLIRSVGAHADVAARSRTLLVARTDPGSSWLAARFVDDVIDLASDWLDVAALLAEPSAPSHLLGEPLPTPSRALLVCTNAKRDQCCAVLGRPLAAALAARQEPLTTAVWETSHTGGHRFAPTYVSLPDGYLYGGPDADLGTVAACRGRSSLLPVEQVVELAVLREIGASAPRPLTVTPADGHLARFEVDDDGRRFSVTVAATTAPDRPESCGKGPVPAQWTTATVATVAP